MDGATGEAGARRFVPVDRATWPDFEALIGGRGAPNWCWCMVWRTAGAGAASRKPRERKAAMRRRVTDGEPIGILLYVDEAPVGWCSIAPRATYRPLGGLPAGSDAEERGIWSLACFFVKREHRGLGHGRALLTAAVDHARAAGAKWVEAYPVDPDSPSYRFMGFVPEFAKAGFAEVGRAGSRRHVMRLGL